MISQTEILRRRDMRDVFTFTIDPADAKDFDDALSFEILKCPIDEINDPMVNYQIGVHIADVSHYVKPGSKEDEDAYRRGTSVYLVDRVLPMLPEHLCNNLCSLRPNEDKLCMSVVFTMNAEAKVLKHKICRTVIRSDARLNYDEAQQIITATTDAMNDGGITYALRILNALAQKLREQRMEAGAMNIEQSEMRFHLDEHGHPTDIYFEQPNEAHHLIEEFMLLANRTVAREVGSGRPFIYRVHDLPNQDKMSDLREFKKRITKITNDQSIITNVINMLSIRAQAKAVYSTHNIGHYGLAFSHYTHFTSPIRRYPDLMVHRLIDKYVLTGKPVTWSQQELQDICDHCSACEQEATQAERDSIKLFQALWMSDHLGEILPGHISGVTEFGLFVQLDDSRCEGLVHISTIGNGEYWQLDEKNYRLVCESKHASIRPSSNSSIRPSAYSPITSYTLGDAVNVQVVRADAERGQIDFLLV